MENAWRWECLALVFTACEQSAWLFIFKTEFHKKAQSTIKPPKKAGEYPGFNYHHISFINADESKCPTKRTAGSTAGCGDCLSRGWSVPSKRTTSRNYRDLIYCRKAEPLIYTDPKQLEHKQESQRSPVKTWYKSRQNENWRTKITWIKHSPDPFFHLKDKICQIPFNKCSPNYIGIWIKLYIKDLTKLQSTLFVSLGIQEDSLWSERNQKGPATQYRKSKHPYLSAFGQRKCGDNGAYVYVKRTRSPSWTLLFTVSKMCLCHGHKAQPYNL